MTTTIDKIDLRSGESIFITARGSTEVSVHIRESGGRLIIRGPMNSNSKEVVVEYDMELKEKSPPVVRPRSTEQSEDDKTLQNYMQEAYDEPEPKQNPSQRTLAMGVVPPEFLEIVQPGQGEKAALRGPRERKPSNEWDRGMTLKCYKAFMEVLENSPDGAPITHIIKICDCKNTANAHAAKLAVLKNHPLDYVYVERRPWPQDVRKLRGIMHTIRAKELGLEIIISKEKEANKND